MSFLMSSVGMVEVSSDAFLETRFEGRTVLLEFFFIFLDSYVFHFTKYDYSNSQVRNKVLLSKE